MWFINGVLALMVLLAVDSGAKNGCDDAVKGRCQNGKASVCLTSKCPHATIGGKQFKNSMLARHNEYRKKPFTNGSFGGDMNVLTWDDQLAAAALGWAHVLCITNVLEHDDNECRVTARYDSVGQNAFVGSGREYGNDTYAANQATESWYKEIQNTTPQYMFPFKWNVDAGHYTALVWSRSYRMGCGLVRLFQGVVGYKVW
ncbi:venom allergen 5-like [Tropilaelaps mercedesae]|uniref:Venom allergen 5-like n=1 Tax=Tropilaelaps mercedesae TaxID=418985 RepID=A0A1V9X1V7_9ACAR|nr:venom allergen 5-like [Tropilaelaps mercedesae]